MFPKVRRRHRKMAVVAAVVGAVVVAVQAGI